MKATLLLQFSHFFFLCSICRWNLISAVSCHRLIVWNKLHLRLLHRKNRDYREESWWPQPLLERWYLTDSDRFEISTSVGEKEKSQLQKMDSLGSGAWLNPGTSFYITKFKFCMGLHGFVFKDGTNSQRSGLDLHLFSVVVIVHRNLQKYAKTPRKSKTKFSYFTVLQKHLHLFFFSASFIDRYSCLFYPIDCLVYMFV